MCSERIGLQTPPGSCKASSDGPRSRPTLQLVVGGRADAGDDTPLLLIFAPVRGLGYSQHTQTPRTGGTVPRHSARSQGGMEANESIYRAHADPWGYFSAAEQIKYERTIAAARRWKPRPQRVLEVACSLGYMTHMLASYADEVWAYDVSPTAVERARVRCADVPPGKLHIDVGDALAPNYPPDFFDIVFIGDVGLGAHREIGGAVIRQAIPLLREDGLLVVVDNMKPTMQESYAAFVGEQGIDVIDRIWLDDRYWARFRRAVTRILPASIARPLVGNRKIFEWFAAVGRWRGPYGSKHFGVIARRR